MVADQESLPTQEPRRPSVKSVLHHKYLISLLDKDENHDDPSYAGNIYESWPTPQAITWREETQNQPYLKRIRESAQAYPDLGHLASWMEVSTTVSRYKALDKDPKERKERAQRVNVCQIDFTANAKLPPRYYRNSTNLARALAEGRQTEQSIKSRVYVVEDLSQAMIEAFGSHFDIDPHFFRAHINDYMWNTATGDAVELKHLDVFGRQQSHFRVSYLRPRYYKDTPTFEEATRQAAKFNVLRQLDSDRSREALMNEKGAAATFMRAKASIWTRPASGGRCSITILLVDPTLSAGSPLWGGYSSFATWTASGADKGNPKPPRTSLFDDVVYWTFRMHDSDVADIATIPNTAAIPLLWLILSDYQHVVQHVTALLGEIEWEIAIPSMRRDPKVDATMQKLHPWRRNVTLYRSMVSHAMDRIFTKEMMRAAELRDEDHGLQSLVRDFQLVVSDIDRIQHRIERIVSVAQALQSIEESRRAMEQNQNVARLTYLATVFIPLSFVSGFLSMVPDVTQLRTTFWVFFVIAIPLTAFALFLVDFLGGRTKLEKLTNRKSSKDKHA